MLSTDVCTNKKIYVAPDIETSTMIEQLALGCNGVDTNPFTNQKCPEGNGPKGSGGCSATCSS